MKKERKIEIVKFCLGGGSSVLVGYMILYVLTEYFMLWYVASFIFAYIISNAVSFIFQKFWTFRNIETKTVFKQFAVYTTLTILFFFINIVMLRIFTERYLIYYIYSQIICTFIISVASYFTSRIIFAQKTQSR